MNNGVYDWDVGRKQETLGNFYMHDKTLNAHPYEGFPTCNRIGDHTEESLGFSGDTFWVFQNWFVTFFLSFL